MASPKRPRITVVDDGDGSVSDHEKQPESSPKRVTTIEGICPPTARLFFQGIMHTFATDNATHPLPVRKRGRPAHGDTNNPFHVDILVMLSETRIALRAIEAKYNTWVAQT